MIIKPQKALNPSYRKHKPLRVEVNAFIAQLKSCLEAIVLSDQNGESEEHLKEPIKKFFQNTFFQNNLINTKNELFYNEIAKKYIEEVKFSKIGVMTAGGAYTLKKATIDEFPLKELPNEEQKPFIEKVDQILSLKKDNPEADASVLEREIDLMVYALYGLTEEEIEIVENS